MAKPKNEINIRLQPKQHELLGLCESGRANWIGYGGSRGGGKSAAARRVMVLRRFSNPGTWGCIIRRVFGDIKQNHIDKFLNEFPYLEQYYRRAASEIDFPNGSKILFNYAETADEVKRKFHGPEFMDIFVDQAEQFSEEELHQMKMANRWPGVSDDKCKLVCFFNPGGIGAVFLKRVFFDKVYKNSESSQDFAFIQAYGWDNVEWAREALKHDGEDEKSYYSWDSDARFDYFIQRTQYGKELNSLPAALRMGALLGSFERFEGQYFGSVFDQERQVIPPDAAMALMQSWWSRWISVDWGFAHHAAVLWHTKGTVSPQEFKRVLGWNVKNAQQIELTYREYAARQVAEADLAAQIISRTPENERPISKIFLSPDAFAKRGSANTVAQQMGDVFVAGGLPRPYPADNDRIGGWRLMYAILKQSYDLRSQQLESIQ